jgi:hypothetical protein
MSEIAKTSKIRYATVAPLFEQLLDKKVPFAAVKGEPLSIAAYGKLGQRHSGDIDILVPRKHISTKEAAEKWGITERRIQKLCEESRIPGVVRFSRVWAIPKNAKKPADARRKEK